MPFLQNQPTISIAALSQSNFLCNARSLRAFLIFFYLYSSDTKKTCGPTTFNENELRTA